MAPWGHSEPANILPIDDWRATLLSYWVVLGQPGED